jgi:hypothetical protein
MKKFLCLLVLVAGVAFAQAPGTLPGYLSGFPSPMVGCSQTTLPSWLNSDWAPIFNGVNQFSRTAVAAANYPRLDSPRTVMLWVKLLNSSANGYWFYTGLAATSKIFSVGFSTSQKLTINFYGSYAQCNPAFTPPVGSWTHIAVTYSGGDISNTKAYVNGESKAVTTSASATSALASSTIYLGAFGASTFSNSQIAEVSYWNRDLPPDEIKKYMPKRLKGTEPGLVFLAHGNDNSQEMRDDSQNRCNLTATNTITWTRRNGYPAGDIRSQRYCLSFDGGDDIGSGTNTLVSTYPYTMEAWVFTPSLTAGKECYPISLASSSSASAYAYIGTYNNAGTYKVTFNRNSTPVEYTIGNANVIGQWVHVAMVASAAQALLYVNGVNVATDSSTKAFSPDYNRLGIGAIRCSTTYYGYGKVAEVRLWNTARTGAEIQANMYTQLIGNESGLCSYFRGSEGAGTSLANMGQEAVSSLLVNGPAWVGRDIP